MAGKGTDLAKHESLDSQIEALRTEGKLTEASAEEDRTGAMVQRITEATTPEEILGASSGAKDMVGRIIAITGVNFLESNLRDGYFAVVEYQPVEDGKVMQRTKAFTAGSVRLIAQLVALLKIGAIPGQVARVASTTVEYQPGSFGDTFYLELVR